MQTLSFTCETTRTKRTSSRFRLTPNLYRLMNRQLTRYGFSLPGYLRFLYDRYESRIRNGLLRPAVKPKRLYQPSGVFLNRDFLPDNDLWVAFGQLAAFLNWSRCRLFSELVRLDAQESEQNEVPVHKNSILSSIFNYSETLLRNGKLWNRRLRKKEITPEHEIRSADSVHRKENLSDQ